MLVTKYDRIKKNGVINIQKSKFGGMEVMEVNEAKRLIELEEENRGLKEMVADLSLENKLKDEVIKKNGKDFGAPKNSMSDTSILRY